MSILEVIPPRVRRLARRIIPAPIFDSVRGYIIHHYSPGRVSHTDPIVYWFRRRVLHRKPVLHRLIVHVTDHCNLNCKGCTHFSNIAKPHFADVAEFERDFARMSELFPRITEIFLLGGEPLLHPEVESFIRITRERFPKARINLMSNGVMVPRMAESFWTTMHKAGAWLLLDLYPIGLPTEEIEALAREHEVNLEWTDPRGEFFKLPLDLEGTQDAADSFERCRGVNNCPTLRDGRLYPCAFCAYIDIFEDRFGVEGVEAGPEDSISIYDVDDPYAIMDFLLNPVPWCSHCDFDSMTNYEWARSERCIEEWTVDGDKRE